eukprot:gnl/TRDRNA2_/TRDRNA2_159087_c3_seq1.p1 gnl/TRDRNA2_/TRDRNA2_159087_c3~~gnl/TRDRNA2_/TRDRNA2_159087_c3_seq1.p1  ORF type:complete len:107 (-),score=31.22 gnl/TRDRNA2_/TRDRNA2_159087_c3_seq1:222-515(-)
MDSDGAKKQVTLKLTSQECAKQNPPCELTVEMFVRSPKNPKFDEDKFDEKRHGTCMPADKYQERRLFVENFKFAVTSQIKQKQLELGNIANELAAAV